MKALQLILLVFMTYYSPAQELRKTTEKRLEKSEKKPVYCLREKSNSSGTYYLYEKNFRTFCPK